MWRDDRVDLTAKLRRELGDLDPMLVQGHRHRGRRAAGVRQDSDPAPLRKGLVREGMSHVVELFDGLDNTWDISPDGTYFVTLELIEPPRLMVVLGWFTELERLVPKSN